MGHLIQVNNCGQPTTWEWEGSPVVFIGRRWAPAQAWKVGAVFTIGPYKLLTLDIEDPLRITALRLNGSLSETLWLARHSFHWLLKTIWYRILLTGYVWRLVGKPSVLDASQWWSIKYNDWDGMSEKV
jgi:hypothetical protein